MVYYGILLAEEIDGTYKTDDYLKNYIGIGGTCTLKTENDNYDLTEATINMVTKTISGKNTADIKAGFTILQAETTTISFNEISELIFEGFCINENNRATVTELVKSNVFQLTKIPRRD